jgi:hypothetical protein
LNFLLSCAAVLQRYDVELEKARAEAMWGTPEK